MLPAAVAASQKGERPVPVRSAVRVKGYPSPVVPLCERVDDSYFENVLLVGDSLSSGFPHYKVLPSLEVHYRIGLSPISVARNEDIFFPRGRGKPGIKLADTLLERNPRVIYLWLGLNGVEGNSAEEVLPHYDIMLNILIEALPNTLFCLVELPPMSKEAVRKKGGLRAKNINAFNAGLYELAQEHNIYILQIHDGLLGNDDAIAKINSAADGIHLSRTGYSAMVDYLYTHALPLENVLWPEDDIP